MAGTLKGHDFSDACGGAACAFMPAALRPGGRAHSPERVAAWAEEMAARWSFVETCEACGRELVAEEAAAHRLAHVPEPIRSLARDLAALPRDQRTALLGLFGTGGILSEIGA